MTGEIAEVGCDRETATLLKPLSNRLSVGTGTHHIASDGSHHGRRGDGGSAWQCTV